MDPHKSLDFGLGEGGGGGKKRRSVFFGGEKKTASQRQLSMDMNLSSPYLLPPGLQQSRESLHSLARTLHQNEDPYRPVAQYTASDVGSIRSFEKSGQGSSIYTGSSKEKEFSLNGRSPSSQGTLVAPPRQNSFPKSPMTPQAANMPDEPKVPESALPSPPPAVKENFLPPQPVIPEIETVPYPEDVNTVPLIQEPPKIARKGLPSSPSPPASGNQEDMMKPKLPEIHANDQMHVDFGQDFHGHGNQQDAGYPLHQEPPAIGLGVMDAAPQQVGGHMSPPSVKSLPAGPQPQQVPAPQGITPVIEEAQDYYDYDYQGMPQNSQHGYDDYDERGRTMQRQSSLYQQPEQQGGLNVPGFNSKRLSVGFRPLPPDEFMETEDPETRANRIRSFYKEYFDESKQDPAGGAGGHAQYYEDYDQSYLGETAFFDPDSNQFIMPYAQPVARRAMTPPPSGSRFPGPRGPGPRGPGPRGPGGRPHAGSIGGMSMPGGYRPGSSASSRWGPRPGSSASARFGPRAGSAMSGKPRKPMAPPPALSTLPTPSKLKDDSFAIFNAMDFAPPESFKERARGRSQSPSGERRPYKLTVPIAQSPLVSSYDEVAALPSP